MTEKPKKERYEDHVKVVEDAVRALEEGKLDLEESIERYEQGMKALQRCREILAGMEKRIEVLVQQKDGALSTKTFEADGVLDARRSAPKR